MSDRPDSATMDWQKEYDMTADALVTARQLAAAALNTTFTIGGGK